MLLRNSICAFGARTSQPNASEVISKFVELYRVLLNKIYRVTVRSHIDKTYIKGIVMDKNQLREETIEFAVLVADICDDISGCSVYKNQIIRSSSSIGANLFEAKYAQSRADFINKLEIALKESSETEYWIELLFRKNKLTEENYCLLRNKCGAIRRKLISSVTTAKSNSK